ncbi:MAG: hypothetical protein AAF958_11895 [Planctomycetota bacterium]
MKPLLMLSLDGLSPAAIGAYGCTWNHTPALDAIAAGGWVADRCCLRRDGDETSVPDWCSQDIMNVRNASGRTLLLTDDVDLARRVADTDAFSEVRFVGEIDTESKDERDGEADGEAGGFESTRLGRLIAEAILAETASLDARAASLIWVHSRFLRDRWDGPLATLSDAPEIAMDPADEADDEISHDEISQDENLNGEISKDEKPHDGGRPSLPIPPPMLHFDEQSDPDELSRWLERYASQIRFVDYLVEAWLAASSFDDPQFALFSTAGFALGQNGWLGYRAGPLRSSHLHAVAMVSDHGPMRWPHLIDDGWIKQLVRGGFAETMNAKAWADPTGETHLRITSARADLVVMTPSWLALRQRDGTESLFLKPDDRFDKNDVARLRPDILEELLG